MFELSEMDLYLHSKVHHGRPDTESENKGIKTGALRQEHCNMFRFFFSIFHASTTHLQFCYFNKMLLVEIDVTIKCHFFNVFIFEGNVFVCNGTSSFCFILQYFNLT